MTDITIYTSANNGEEILVFPIVPENLPQIVQEFCHEDFESNEKSLTLIGRKKARTLTLDLLLPVNKTYSKINKKANTNGWAYIDFWNKWSEREVPMRLVITEGANELLNIAYTIDNLTYVVDRKKDIKATLKLKEYIFTQEPQKEEKGYKWENVNIRFHNAIMTMEGSNVEGHWLIPVRKLLESLQFTVEWNAEEKAVYYSYPQETEKHKMATSSEIYNGTSYSYVYAICNEIGYTTEWDQQSKTVMIFDGK